MILLYAIIILVSGIIMGLIWGNMTTEIKKQLKIIQEQLQDQVECNAHVIKHMQVQVNINDLLRTEVKALKREVQAVMKGNSNLFNIPDGASIMPDGHGGYRVFETLADLKDPWPGEGEKA